MDKLEIIELINSIKTKPGIKLQLNKLPVNTILQVAAHYQLEVFGPEEHLMRFYFTKGYYDEAGRISGDKKTAAGSFSLTSNQDFPEMLTLP